MRLLPLLLQCLAGGGGACDPLALESELEFLPWDLVVYVGHIALALQRWALWGGEG